MVLNALSATAVGLHCILPWNRLKKELKIYTNKNENAVTNTEGGITILMMSINANPVP